MLNQHPTTFDIDSDDVVNYLSTMSNAEYHWRVECLADDELMGLYESSVGVENDLMLIEASILRDCGIDASELERLLGSD